ncbi:MAG: amino acid permease [Marinilabiliales bacterium]|nr:MAG: amino acid permease [Marinilabiliales bacterium]
MTQSAGGSRPAPTFTTLSSMAVVVGIVVGIGIFRLPPIVALNSAGELQFILFWVFGGLVSLMGALCYAELSSSMPDSGGEYYFLRKAFGPATGFFLSWGRMTVIQTGSLALIAFILGDYASLLLNLGPYSPSIYAALAVMALTGLNIMGTIHSSRTQSILASVIVATIIIIGVSALLFTSGEAVSGITLSGKGGQLFSGGAPGAAMIFVLLTYGGWSEAAYLTGELRNVRRSIVRALVFGIVIITGLYVMINLAYLHVLGFETLQGSSTVGYDLTERVFGTGGSILVVIIVIVAALSTANATIITGARTNYAIGRDFRLFGFMGRWNHHRNSPQPALIFQASIAMALVVAGAFSKEAVSTMVDYTAPVFWFFLALTTLSLFVFRLRKEGLSGSYKVPLYPLPPLLFLAACIYMLYSSLVFTGIGALAGVSILAAGIPVWFLAVKFQKK